MPLWRRLGSILYAVGAREEAKNYLDAFYSSIIAVPRRMVSISRAYAAGESFIAMASAIRR
jgi:hypothetical protein